MLLVGRLKDAMKLNSSLFSFVWVIKKGRKAFAVHHFECHKIKAKKTVLISFYVVLWIMKTSQKMWTRKKERIEKLNQEHLYGRHTMAKQRYVPPKLKQTDSIRFIWRVYTNVIMNDLPWENES